MAYAWLVFFAAPRSAALLPPRVCASLWLAVSLPTFTAARRYERSSSRALPPARHPDACNDAPRFLFWGVGGRSLW